MARESGPLLENFDKEFPNIIQQELTTFYMRDNIMVKETVTRKYNGSDYVDTTSVSPLVQK